MVRDDLRPCLAEIDLGAYPDGVLLALWAAEAYGHHARATPEGLLAAIDAMAAAGEACLSTAF